MVTSNVIYDQEDLEFLNTLKYVVEHHSELEFDYNGKGYRIEFIDGKLCAYLDEADTPEHYFVDLDDLLEHYLLDGVPFKDKIPEIGAYGAL